MELDNKTQKLVHMGLTDAVKTIAAVGGYRVLAAVIVVQDATDGNPDTLADAHVTRAEYPPADDLDFATIESFIQGLGRVIDALRRSQKGSLNG